MSSVARCSRKRRASPRRCSSPSTAPGTPRGRAGPPRAWSRRPGFVRPTAQFVAGGWPALGGAARVRRPAGAAGAGDARSGSSGARPISRSSWVPMLTHGAVHALELCGSPAQKQRYLPKMVSGEWTGTMVLTEPQAGSDLGQVRTRAAPEGDHYRLFGPEDLHHLGRPRPHRQHHPHGARRASTARPPGSRASRCSSCRSSWSTPTARLARATRCAACRSSTSSASTRVPPACWPSARRTAPLRYLVGEPGRGLEYMFIMMNSARLSVGSEGYAVGERAFQRAAEWARTRVQGKPPVAAAQGPLPIINHPDVKRMLLVDEGADRGRARADALHRLSVRSRRAQRR